MKNDQVPILKVELHLHNASDPVDNLPLDMVSTVEHAAKLGFDAIAVTNHNSVYLPDAADREAAARAGIVLLSGIEATLDRGVHVLILNCGPEAETIRTLADLERLRRPEYLVIAPHAWYPGRCSIGRSGLLERWAHLFDAIEWCHFWHPSMLGPNKKAAAFARLHGLPLVGTGDVHLPDQMGRTYVRVRARRDVDSIVEAVRAGHVRTATRPLSLIHMGWILFRLGLRNQALNPRIWRRLLQRPRLPSRWAT